MKVPVPPRVTWLKVRNYRALRDVTLSNLTPLTVLLGPNGSGKSTVFDVFAFLSECFSEGIRRPWDRRGRFRELRSRDRGGPIMIELKYRERPKTPLITYHLELDEDRGRPVVTHEWLRWTRGSGAGRPFNFMEYRLGEGEVITGEAPERNDKRVPRKLAGPDVLAAGVLGLLAENPRVIAFRDFVTSWHLLSAGAAIGNPEAGGEAGLWSTGDNLANVVRHLREEQPVPPRLIGIGEPERSLYPRLLPELGEECRAASARTQLLISTHSPFFLNALRPEEARVLWRGGDGYTRTGLLSSIRGVTEFVEEGASLGDLWMEGHFGVGDPLVNEGAAVGGSVM